MVFSSILFLYYFLPAVLIIYYLSPKKAKNFVLFISSLVFYAWGEPYYIILMLFSILFNYALTIVMDRQKSPKKRKALLFATVAVDLAILGFYKYSGLFWNTVNSLFGLSVSHKSVSLPIGISFYTFQIISYVADVYKKDVKAQKNPISLGTYIALFPQLIAGPIVRYSSIDKQLSERKINADMILTGIGTFSCGLAKKVFLANNIGMLWETVKSTPMGEISVLSAWLGIIAYTLQIYFDFSGYSDMAVGLGRMLGFEFDINFNYPYISKSITEFWRRWHISLSSWFKEYVYIPLGGNRRGQARMCLNIMIVWFLTGLWHGASYNFILWGVYYGLLLMVEKLFLKKYLRRLPKAVSHIYTMLFVMVGWVLFASEHLKGVISYLSVMFGNAPFVNSSFLYLLRSNFAFLIIGIIASFPVGKELYARLPEKLKTVLMLLLSIVSIYICTAYLLDSTYNPFLYFRF